MKVFLHKYIMQDITDRCIHRPTPVKKAGLNLN